MGQKLGFERRRRRKFGLFWKFPYSPPQDGGGEWIFCSPSWSHFLELDNLPPPKMRGRIRKFLITMGGNNILLPCFGGENDFLRGRIIFCYQDPERWGGRINSAHPNAKRWGHNELGSPPPQDGGGERIYDHIIPQSLRTKFAAHCDSVVRASAPPGSSVFCVIPNT